MLTTNLEPVYGIIWLILSLAERKWVLNLHWHW
jgi:hypothetical protein